MDSHSPATAAFLQAPNSGSRDLWPGKPPEEVVWAGQRHTFALGRGVGIELCGIPAGTFLMGSPGGEKGRRPDELRHEVTLTAGFWLGRTEVTQAQWQVLAGDNPCRFKGADLPVERVTWTEAAAFCAKLDALRLLPAGWRWALPTEAQWEHACRAGSTAAYAGKNWEEMAWHSGNSLYRTHAVGTKQPNAWGLCDMHGNVWEWCADWYAAYPGEAVTDPTGPASGSHRVARGGSWHYDGALCRSASRLRLVSNFRDSFCGFRVAALPPVAVGSPP